MNTDEILVDGLLRLILYPWVKRAEDKRRIENARVLAEANRKLAEWHARGRAAY